MFIQIYINHIIYDGYKYVATRLIWDHNGLSVDDPGNIATSIDLTNWSIHALADSKLDIFDLFYSNNLYFAIGYHDQTESIFTSTDGLDWKEIELFRGVPVSDMKYLNGEYIFVGPFGVIYTSPDGKKWINHSILFGPDFRTVARGPNDYLITATQKTTEIWTTSDWVSWKQDIYKEPTPGLKYWFTGTERSLFGINNGSIYVLAGFDCPDICTGFILTSP